MKNKSNKNKKYINDSSNANLKNNIINNNKLVRKKILQVVKK